MIISEKQIMRLMNLVRFLCLEENIDQDVKWTGAKLINEIENQQSEELKVIE